MENHRRKGRDFELANKPVGLVKIGPIKGSLTQLNAISLPFEMYEQHHSSITKLKIGQREAKVICEKNLSDDILLLSKVILNKCNFYEGMPIHYRIEGDTLRLGPLIGILAGKGYIQKLKKQEPTFRTIELVKANREANVPFFFFSIDGINLKRRSVQGISYNILSGRWGKNTYPLPDVLYDRGSGRAMRRYPKHVYVRNRLEELSVVKVNSQHFLDKWDLYQKLSQYEELKNYLPKTKIYDPLQLKEMLGKYTTVYLKASIGGMGRRVMRVSKEKNQFHYSVFRKSLTSGTVSTVEALHQAVYDFFGEDRLIMQQGIPLHCINNGIVDMRATLQRDGQGELMINSIAVRIGAEGSPVTSTRSGSNVLRFEDYLLKYGSHLPSDIRERVNKFLLTVYLCIEHAYGRFGEMGIDFGMDAEGNTFFIESNAKPAKDSLYNSHDQHVIHQAFLNPLIYAKYLSGF